MPKKVENKILVVSAENFKEEIEEAALSDMVKVALIHAVDRLLVHKTRAPHNIFERLVEMLKDEVETVIVDGIPYDLIINKNDAFKGYKISLTSQTASAPVSG